MELSVEQERRLAALRDRRPTTVELVTPLGSTLDVRASESTRLVTSALAFLAVSAGVVGLRATDSLSAPPATTGNLLISQPAPTATFTLPALTPTTAAAQASAATIGTVRVDSITQGT